MTDDILKEAKKYIKKPDWIWDLFDFSVIWFSDKISKLSGYSKTELNEVELYDIFLWDKDKIHKFLSIEMASDGELSAPVKTKEGKIFESTNKYHNFEFDKGFYRVGEILKFVEKK